MSERLVRFSLMDRLYQTEDNYLVCLQFGAVTKKLRYKVILGILFGKHTDPLRRNSQREY